MTLRQRWKQTSLPNKLLIETGALVAFGTLFYAGAAVFQVCLMKRAAKDQSAQVDAISARAQAVVDSMNKAMSDGRDALDKSLKENRAALDASATQSKAALDASIKSSRTDQRAWIGVGPISREAFVSGNQNPIFYVRIANSGKTPALLVEQVNRTSFLNWGANDPDERSPFIPASIRLPDDRLYPSMERRGKARISGMIPPNGVSTIVHGASFPVRGFDDIQSGNATLFLQGIIWYTDIFKEEHWTRYCFKFLRLPAPGVFEPCQSAEKNDGN